MKDLGALDTYYQQLADKLNEFAPVGWVRIAMFGINEDDYQSISFYFWMAKDPEPHHSGSIPDHYGMDLDTWDQHMSDLGEINRALRNAFIEMQLPVWYQISFILDSDWNFTTEFNYEDERSEVMYSTEPMLRWAYEKLGILPETESDRKELREYLQRRKLTHKWQPIHINEKPSKM